MSETNLLETDDDPVSFYQALGFKNRFRTRVQNPDPPYGTARRIPLEAFTVILDTP